MTKLINFFINENRKRLTSIVPEIPTRSLRVKICMGHY